MAVIYWSLGPLPSGRLKNIRDVDKQSSLKLSLLVRGMPGSMSLEITGCTCAVGMDQ